MAGPDPSEYRFGPVDFYLVGLAGDRPAPGTIDALKGLIDSGLVRLLDLIIISRDADGNVSTTELENEVESIGVGPLGAAGIAGQEDIDEFAGLVESGSSAVLAVLEMTYQRDLAASVAAAGGTLLGYERVAAPVVNALVDAIE